MMNILNKINKYCLTLFIVLTISLGLLPQQQVFAQATCSYEGQCVDNKICECFASCDSPTNRELATGSKDCGSAIIGGVKAPGAVKNINIKSTIHGGGSIGILYFVSRLIKFASIVAGIFVLWNFISAGFIYVSSAGNSNAVSGARDKIMWSLVGILIIVSAYTIMGLIGLVFFKNPTFLLNPKLEGAI